MLVSCGQNVQWPQVSPATSSPLKGPEDSKKYNTYLLLMDNQQRHHFLQIRDNKKKDVFLREQGIEEKKYLEENLRRGISTEEVESILGRPQIRQEDIEHDLQNTYWTYRIFNGERYFEYHLSFIDKELLDWEVK